MSQADFPSILVLKRDGEIIKHFFDSVEEATERANEEIMWENTDAARVIDEDGNTVETMAVMR
jgi:hypothetical protein